MMESHVNLQLAQTARICHYRESKGNMSNGQKPQGYSGEDTREKEEAVGCAGRTMTDERVALERFASVPLIFIRFYRRRPTNRTGWKTLVTLNVGERGDGKGMEKAR